MTGSKRTLLLFTLTRMDDMLQKGNVWYLRHYESHFDRIYVAYLLGTRLPPRRKGKTILISLGCIGKFLNLLVAPIRLLNLSKKVMPTHYLTADIFFSWWTGFLIRSKLEARIVLMPVCVPPEMYLNTGRNIIGLPRKLEELLMYLSFSAARRVIMGKNSEASLKWLRAEPAAVRKLKIVELTAEELPPKEIYEGLQGFNRNLSVLNKPARLLYVGRLHTEKLPMGLVDLVANLRKMGILANLVIAGDGALKTTMRARARELGVDKQIDFMGFVDVETLVNLYRNVDVFISTVTGTSLREAGLFGLPVVAYRVDWVKDLIVDGKNGLLAESGDSKGLAEQVAKLLDNMDLRVRIAREFKETADQRWTCSHLSSALEASFADL